MGQTIATVIGRGHGGTRAAAGWLRSAGFDIGPTNDSLDRRPFDDLYAAGRLALAAVPQTGPRSWDVAALNESPIPDEWLRLIDRQLARLGDGDLVAWKLPETLFSYPWLARRYPEIAYVVWHQDPRNAILRKHGTDDLGRWGLAGWPEGLQVVEERALSWRVQFDLVEAVPPPPRSVSLRLRDFVLDQPKASARVGGCLGVPMPPFPARRETLTRWHGRRGEFGRAWDVIAPYLPRFQD